MDIELVVGNPDAPQPQGEAFNLILKEKNGDRFLPVVIGISEGKAIIMEVNKIPFGRPIAHDLLIQLCEKTGLKVTKILIYDFLEGVYFVHVYIDENGFPIRLDARISDAVIIALKKKIPIYIDSRVFENNCYTEQGKQHPRTISDEIRNFWDTNDDDDSDDLPSDLKRATTEQLKEMLKSALDDEQYELAAEIDAELNTRPDYGK